ncbi:MAG: TetR family transcriptional regulator [Trichocoleus desertorum ATA4-8-CV12]|jgi:AcrR family transcriptional regulator|nr:TetR family transcriptional regulator [Trichocoleus desertorum ATA4-8-CV12]
MTLADVKAPQRRLPLVDASGIHEMTNPLPRNAERSRAAIATAARALFAERGYELTTVRDIAARAQLDPALVMRYFGNKEGLFAEVIDLDLKLPDLRESDSSKAGKLLVQHFLDIWEGEQGIGGLPILLRSASSNERAAQKLRETFATQVAPVLLQVGAKDNAVARVGLITSQMLGLALCRYVLKLPPVVTLPKDVIIEEVGATVQRYLSEALQ